MGIPTARLRAAAGFTGIIICTIAVAHFLRPSIGPPIEFFLTIPALIWISVEDLLEFRIPNQATAVLVILGLAYQYHAPFPANAFNLVSALAIYVSLFAIGEIYFRRKGFEGLGIGDAKLLSACVLWVGLDGFWALLFLASAGGILSHFIILARQPRGTRGVIPIPFGVFITYALIIVMVSIGGV